MSQVREIVFTPTGKARDALVRATRAKAMAGHRLRAAAAEAQQADERLKDVVEAMTGESAEGLTVDGEQGVIYREIEAAGGPP